MIIEVLKPSLQKGWKRHPFSFLTIPLKTTELKLEKNNAFFYDNLEKDRADSPTRATIVLQKNIVTTRDCPLIIESL